MQASQQYSARRLPAVLLLDVTANSEDSPGSGNVIARISELDPRLLLSLGFFVETVGMREESGSINALWIDGMIQGSAYPLVNTGFSSKYGTAVPNLDAEIIRPVDNADGTVTELWGTSLTPAVDTLDLVLAYRPNGGTGYPEGDRIRVYAMAEVGIESDAPPEDIVAVLNRVNLRVLDRPLVGGLQTIGDEN